MMREVTPKNRTPNAAKLLAYGFLPEGDALAFARPLGVGDLTLAVRVAGGRTFARVFDAGSGEDYVLHLVKAAHGVFVGEVRTAFEAALQEIFTACFEPAAFRTAGAARVLSLVRTRFGDEWEYPWPKFPGNAIVRRPDNAKWYAVLLTVPFAKLGVGAAEDAEVLNLRMPAEQVKTAVDGVRFFPAYHMNKTHWITLLPDAFEDEPLATLLVESRALAQQKKAR